MKKLDYIIRIVSYEPQSQVKFDKCTMHFFFFHCPRKTYSKIKKKSFLCDYLY